MADVNDMDLMREYADRNSEAAFAKLVRRHINLVYSVALRFTGNDADAQDVTQKVFVILAQKVAGLRQRTTLTGWLYETTRLAARQSLRTRTRQHARDQEAYMQSTLNEADPDSVWKQLAPLLEEGMTRLNEDERTLLALRFFENKSASETAALLGIQEWAAHKRAQRAVEKLRTFFARRGVALSASALTAAIAANSVQSAPVGLAAAVTAASLSGTAITTSAVIAVTKTIAMNTLQKTIITVTVAALAGAGIYEARQSAQLRAQVQTLQEQQAPLTEQLAQLKTENERLSNQVVQANDSQALSKAQLNELLKLRGKAGVAQADSRELAKLKSTLAQQTGKIPDFFTNAMATGLGTAEKWKLKDAQARLDRMKKMLNLTDDQAKAISDLMQQHIKNQSQLTLAMLTGKFTPEQQKALGADHTSEQAEIQAVFTPEQLAAYPDYLQAEMATAADHSAKNDASQIAGDFNLSAAQQEQIHAAFYQISLNAPQAAVSAAKRSGDLAAVAGMTEELQKSELDEKLKILGNILTPEQINAYREKEINQINMQASAMKMFLPQATNGAAQ